MAADDRRSARPRSIAGADAWLDASVEPEVRRIVLLDGPAVLGWERWREVGMRHGLGLVTALLTELMDAGAIPAQPVEPLAHVLIGALDEAALYVALAADPVRREPRPARCCVASSLRSRCRNEVDGDCQVTARVVPLGRCAAALHAEERHDSAPADQCRRDRPPRRPSGRATAMAFRSAGVPTRSDPACH